MKNTFQRNAGRILVALGHLSAVAAIAMGVTLLIMPWRHARGIVGHLRDVPQLWEASAVPMLLHVGLAACLWASICIIVQLGRIRVAEMKKPAAIRLSKGTVITETLVVMPIYLLLTFGLGQLSINNVGGILANVASYEAARAAWVWQPEVDLGSGDRRMGITNGTAVEKCRIAVALVMMPVAPGDYAKLPMLNSANADKARMMVLGANVPLMGVISTQVPAQAMGVAQAGVAALGAGDLGMNKLSYSATLGGSAFWLRSIRKFTTAFLAAKCEINAGDHSVRMTYRHHNAMPLVGRVFGSLQVLDAPGQRPGYYSDYVRNFGFRKQFNTPNKKLPKNNWINFPSYSSSYDPGY